MNIFQKIPFEIRPSASCNFEWHRDRKAACQDRRLYLLIQINGCRGYLR